MSAQLEPYLLLPNTVNHTMHVLLEKDIIPESRLNNLKDDCKETINPCLIMDQRHKMVGRKKNEDLSLSIDKILKKEDKEKSVIEGEIRRYEKQLKMERKRLLDKSIKCSRIHGGEKQKICSQGSKKTELTNMSVDEDNRSGGTLEAQPKEASESNELLCKAFSKKECNVERESEFKRPYSARDYKERGESTKALKASRKCKSAEPRRCVRRGTTTKTSSDIKQESVNKVREYCLDGSQAGSTQFIDECNEQLDKIELVEELCLRRRRVQYGCHEERSEVYTEISQGVKQFTAVSHRDVHAEVTDCSITLRKQLVIFQNVSVTGVKENSILGTKSPEEGAKQSRREGNQELSTSKSMMKGLNDISDEQVQFKVDSCQAVCNGTRQDGLRLKRATDRTRNHSSADILALKYGQIWLTRARDKLHARQVERQNKIASFVSNLEKFVEQKNNKKSPESKEGRKKEIVNKEARERKIYGESFRNRLEMQKDIISKQKSILEEQKRKIKELEEKKVKKCQEAEKTDKPTVKVAKKERKSIKPPVFVSNMQKRAEERQKQRERLKETQRRKEEEKQVRLIREEEEKKTRQEEIKRKEIEEREMEFLRKLLHDEGIRREREMVREAKERLIQLHRRELLSRGLLAFKQNLLRATAVREEMDKVYMRGLLRRSFYLWRKQTARAKLQSELLAVTYYQQNLLRKGMEALKKNRLEAVHDSQVADDVYDLNLIRRGFNLWFLHHKQTKRKLQHLTTLANLFYERALVRKCFNAWKRLPEVLFKEREEEARIRRWEEKVRTVLSDFKIS